MRKRDHLKFTVSVDQVAGCSDFSCISSILRRKLMKTELSGRLCKQISMLFVVDIISVHVGSYVVRDFFIYFDILFASSLFPF